MKKPKRDPRAWAIEVNGGVICQRGFLLRAKRPAKSQRRTRESESVIAHEFTQGLEIELRDVLRKLPGLKAWERKSRAAKKSQENWRDLMMVDRRMLRRVIKGRLVELAKTQPFTSLN